MSPGPLRLTLVTETFPPEVNGVARTLGRWVDTFRRRGHLVQILRPRQSCEGPLPERIHGLPLPFYPRLRCGVASPVRLRSLLAGFGPDLIHLATEGPLGLAALLAAAALPAAVASSFHTNFDQYLSHYGLAGLEWVAGRYLRWFHNRTAVTLVPSESTRQRLRADGIRRVEIWSRGVDAEAFHPRHRSAALRRSLGLGRDDLLLLFVGRLAVEKNLPTLVRAFPEVRQSLPGEMRDRVRLALVGDGPLSEQLRGQQLPQVVLPGELHGQELAAWYASGDIFVFPSRSETFGSSILEAQASGLPVIGFDCQAVNERIAHEKDGLLVQGDEDLAGAILRLCLDEESHHRFARAAREKAERQSWDAIFDGLEGCYRGLIEERARRG